MTQQEEIQNFRDSNPDGIFGFAFYNSDIQQMQADNPDSNGIRIVFGIDDNGNQTAYLEAANLPEQEESKESLIKESLMSISGGTGGGGLPCPTFCN